MSIIQEKFNKTQKVQNSSQYENLTLASLFGEKKDEKLKTLVKTKVELSSDKEKNSKMKELFNEVSTYLDVDGDNDIIVGKLSHKLRK